MKSDTLQTATPVNVLSLDGGGIRGLIPAMFLAAIEKQTGKAISELFDIIAGTSTGGILGLALVKPDEKDKTKPAYRAADLISLYEKEGGKIFSQDTFDSILGLGGLTEEKYSAKGLEKLLKEYFGQAELGEALTDILITSYDIENRKPFYFKSRLASRLEKFNFRMRDVARATSAAPTYFEPAKITSIPKEGKNSDPKPWVLVDGGVFANNPGLLGFAEANIGKDLKNICLCSIGTGQTNKALKYEAVKDWGSIQWVKPLIDVVFDGVSDSVDEILKRLLTYDHDYYRFQVELKGVDENMDNVDKKNLASLGQLANKLIYPSTDEAGNPVLNAHLKQACDQLMVNKYFPLRAKDVAHHCNISPQKAAAQIKKLKLHEDTELTYCISKNDSVDNWYSSLIIVKVKSSL